MDQNRSAPLHLLPFNISNSSSLMEIGCRDVKMRRKEQFKRKRNSQGKDPNTFEGNSERGDPRTLEGNCQGGARVPHRPRINVGRKETSASHRRSAQSSGRRIKEEVKASRRDGATKKRGRKEGGGKRERRKRKRRGTKEFVRGAGRREDNEVVEEV